MSPVNLFPMFLKLNGRDCLVVGGGRVGTRKVRALLDTNARVSLVSREVTEDLKGLIDEGVIKYHKGDFHSGLLDGVLICISALDDRGINEEVVRSCRERGVLVNVVDTPEMCDFYFSSVVRRGDLTIAISTSGASPSMARYLREEMEELYGPEYGTILKIMGYLRESLMDAGVRGDRRGDVLGRVAGLPLAELIHQGGIKEAQGMIKDILEGSGVGIDIDLESLIFSEGEDTGADIFVVGMSHKTAPVDVREKMGIRDDRVREFLMGLKRISSIIECLLISTCNRVEIVGYTRDIEDAVTSSISYLGGFHGRDPEEMRGYFYVKEGREAVRHVFKVTSAVDSMVVGEPQILGQVKNSYREATGANTTGLILNRLMHRAFFAAKRVKNETDIALKPVSVSSAAVWLAMEGLLGELSGKVALMVGAGEMGEETLRTLCGYDLKSVLIANRTMDTAKVMARRFGAEAISWERLPDALFRADVVISSTGSEEPVITVLMMEGVMVKREGFPITIIDIGVPRDVEVEVRDIDKVSLFNIDDLVGVVKKNLKEREGAARISEEIISQESEKFIHWLESLDTVPTIVSLRERLHEIGDEELNKTLSSWSDINDSEREQLKRLTNSIIKKVLHNPTVYLKKEAWLEGNMTVDIIRGLFGLRKGGNEEGQDRNQG